MKLINLANFINTKLVASKVKPDNKVKLQAYCLDVHPTRKVIRKYGTPNPTLQLFKMIQRQIEIDQNGRWSWQTRWHRNRLRK